MSLFGTLREKRGELLWELSAMLPALGFSALVVLVYLLLEVVR